MITNYHAQHLLATDLSSLRFASKCTPDRLLWSGTARLTSYLWHFRPAIDRTTGWQWHSRRRRRWTRVLRSLGFGLATDVHLLSSPSSGCFSWSRFTIFANKHGGAVEELPELRPKADVLCQAFEECKELLYLFSRAFPPPQTAACMADSTRGSVSH